jgi:hypothetical protein
MLLKFENTDTETNTSFLKTATLWGPDAEEGDEKDDTDWDEDDDDIDEDTAEDTDDLHEIQVNDDLDEPGPEGDEHFPEEDE